MVFHGKHHTVNQKNYEEILRKNFNTNIGWMSLIQQLPRYSEGVIVELDVQFTDEETERLYRAHEQTIDLQLNFLNIDFNIVTFERDQSFDFVYFCQNECVENITI